MKTATLERYHCFGTPNHHIRLTYRGETLHWRDMESPGLSFAFADCPHFGTAEVNVMIDRVRRFGFTHIKFTGDWRGHTVRKGMKL